MVRFGSEVDLTDSLVYCYTQWVRRIVSNERFHVCEPGRQCRTRCAAATEEPEACL